MNHLARACSILLAGLALCGGGPARAELTRIQVGSRTDVLAGKPFGTVGAYEKIIGKAFFAVDPLHPANAAIVDLDKAPRDAQGRVNFSADLYALIPKDAARGNGVALIDVLNRGNKVLLTSLNLGPLTNDPIAEADFGDGFLLRHGYALVWVGWQFDIPSRDSLMGLDAPQVLDQGRSVTGQVTTQFVPDSAADTYPLDSLANYGDTTRYPPVDPASSANTLTVRDGYRADPQAIPHELWQFGRAVGATVAPDVSAVFLKGGFASGHVYELTYEARGAVVAGLGFAALRDTAAALKNSSLPMSARYTVAFGASQDGRLLRELMYEGFNADEFGRRAFDGVIAHIAGAARSADFNAHFARPNRLGAFEASLFPYLDAESRDPVTGRMDGLLSKLAPELQPKIFYTNSSVEYWGLGRSAALTILRWTAARTQRFPIMFASIISPVPSTHHFSIDRASNSQTRINMAGACAPWSLPWTIGSKTGQRRPKAVIRAFRIIAWCASRTLIFPSCQACAHHFLFRGATGLTSGFRRKRRCYPSWCRR